MRIVTGVLNSLDGTAPLLARLSSPAILIGGESTREGDTVIRDRQDPSPALARFGRGPWPDDRRFRHCVPHHRFEAQAAGELVTRSEPLLRACSARRPTGRGRTC